MTERVLRVAWAGLACLVVGIATTEGAEAANWAESLFQESGHDFGPVPRGAIVRHPFVLQNRLNEPVTILDLRASCGCTSGRASAATVPPGGSAVIEARMDTRNFVGHKATTLTVTLMTASGRQDEVKFGVSSNILADVVLNPGSIDFGSVARGQTPRQVLTIERAGAPNWRVVRMVPPSNAIDATLVESQRSEAGVEYTLTVQVKPDAPAGPIRHEIHVITNDPEVQSVPVMITAQVLGNLTATPSVLALGDVASSTGVQGRFLIRGTTPFTITSIEGDGDGFHLAPAADTPRTLHILTLSYRPDEGRTRGDLRRAFRVHTDLPGEPPVDLTATLHVAP